MENKKRKYNHCKDRENLENSIHVLTEFISVKSESEKELEESKLSEENESCDVENNKSSSDKDSDSDSLSVTIDKQCKEISELQDWIVSKNIPRGHADDLLQILRHRLLPNLPKTVEKLLESPPKLNIQSTEVSNGSTECSETDKLENSNTNHFLEVNVNNPIFNPIDRISNDENTFNPLDIPIIEIRNDESKSDFQSNVLQQLSEINKNISILRQNQEDMVNYLVDKKIIPVDPTTLYTDFSKKYQFNLPLESMENFLLFDEKLKTDKFLLNDVCMELRRLVDKDYSISKSYVQMLKKFLTKDVALQFTAVRKSRNEDKDSKKLFKPTEFCKCMDAALTYKRSETALSTTDSMLKKGLSDVLCNVKNWNKFKES